MTTNSYFKRVQPLEGVLVANAARARLFERDAESGAMRETASFVHPRSRLKGQVFGHDRPGQVMKGEARTAYEPHTDPQHKERAEFAHELMQRLEVLALKRRYSRLMLFASNPFLGELKAQLGTATRQQLMTSVALDLTAFHGAELDHRVSVALEQAGVPMSMAAD